MPKQFLTYFVLTLSIMVFQSCSNGQSTSIKTNLSATEFAEKLKVMPAAPILDVRSPDEFSSGHLANALNYNWNAADFDQNISGLDKSKPVFVYCLSGGRSGSAAAKMRSTGFKEVYELSGGILKWRAANLPETTGAAAVSSGMSTAQFEELISSDKIVLVDFYADWCAPCKKMKPYLDEIANDMKEKVKVVRINADENIALCKSMQIDELPILMTFKNKQQVWKNKGFIEKEAVLKQLK
ncbi:MAG: thioredoxin domain-containing protein [Saprospiraceae bacterium]